MWLMMAVLSALFAGLTSVLAKGGIRKTDSDVVTALRTGVVLIFAGIMTCIRSSVGITGMMRMIGDISGRSLLFLVLSGIATGASWICYFRALAMGDVNKVVPVDKSSTILTVLLAIVIFGETNNLPIKLGCTCVLAIGIYMMIDRRVSDGKNTEEKVQSKWLPYAAASAVFAALTSILAKIGVSGVDSGLATFVRTAVVLVMAWLVVVLKGKGARVRSIEKKELSWITLSGIATGASWLCYYYAIQNGIVSIVVPIDKLSVVVAVFFSRILFGEKLSKKAGTGLLLIVAATVAMAVWG